ncbi:MAG: hypothetical protein R3E42_17605 [Burkholderiaceae bacterium]
MVADIRDVVAGDASPTAKEHLRLSAVSKWSVFYLGTKYSKTMNATFLAEDGKPAPLKWVLRIGITRPPAAAVEEPTTSAA